MRPIWLTILLPTLSNVFMTFAWYAHPKEPLELDYPWAALCILGAVCFIFRGRWTGG